VGISAIANAPHRHRRAGRHAVVPVLLLAIFAIDLLIIYELVAYRRARAGRDLT
jgi:hypothetical protein